MNNNSFFQTNPSAIAGFPRRRSPTSYPARKYGHDAHAKSRRATPAFCQANPFCTRTEPGCGGGDPARGCPDAPRLRRLAQDGAAFVGAKSAIGLGSRDESAPAEPPSSPRSGLAQNAISRPRHAGPRPPGGPAGIGRLAALVAKDQEPSLRGRIAGDKWQRKRGRAK